MANASITWMTAIVILILDCLCDEYENWSRTMDFPPTHMPFHLNQNAAAAARCRDDPRCPFKAHLDQDVCWGYEDSCSREKQFSYPSCPGDHNGWVKNKAEQHEVFYNQGDFGYIRQRKKELFPVCTSQSDQQNGAFLECCEHLSFCRGRNIFLNLSSLTDKTHVRYQMDVIGKGDVGGFCTVNQPALTKNLDHMGALQSWAPELRHLTSLDSDPISTGKCDVILDEPTFILKLDATVNMYHHFCDFFNLYATQHLNQTFGTDVRMLLWDMISYGSNFGDVWKAFTSLPVEDLKRYTGKTVCFRDVVFPFLPRLIFGMYYNMPLISGCHSSGLFRAFSHHLIHRLQVPQNFNKFGKVRVTLIMRSTTYRRILNQDELIASMKAKDKELEVRLVDFNGEIEFLEQLKITQNTDILIGMHGAGLTHALFLPDWAAVFEIYNCEDDGCYRDLARLRGVAYFTWEKLEKLKPQDKGHHPTLGAHAKFTNYEFDAEEFMSIVARAAAGVRTHPKWQRRLKETLAPPPHGGEL